MKRPDLVSAQSRQPDDGSSNPPVLTIGGETRLAGTIADPIAHVQAPESMNRWFAARAIDATWLPFHVHPDDLAAFVDGARAIANLAGFTVTMPHKRAIVGLIDVVSERARQIGVVNMVRREADGRLVGDNADGEGFVVGLEGAGQTVEGRMVWLSGAGGAGTAIAWALGAKRPAGLVITDVETDAAERLADRLARAYPQTRFATGLAATRDIDIAINATPAGLHAGDPLPFDPATLRKEAVVVDIIMNPKDTALLRAARARGMATVPGQCMLDSQLPIYASFLGLMPAVSPT